METKKEAQGLLFLSQFGAGYSGTQMLLDQSDISDEFIEPHIGIFAVLIEPRCNICTVFKHRLFRIFVKADDRLDTFDPSSFSLINPISGRIVAVFIGQLVFAKVADGVETFS